MTFAERRAVQPEQSQTPRTSPPESHKAKAQSFDWASEFGSLHALRRAQGVQPEQSQIVGFANSLLHCTTLRVVIRQAPNK